MAKKYSKQEIISFCEKASVNMASFYQENFVNYKGKTKDGEFYTEIIAEWLLDKLDKFKEIQKVERQSSYNIGHTGAMGEKTNREEEFVAKLMFNTHKHYDNMGKLIDYQTPLKNVRADKGVGKIDLLSRNDKDKNVYILELKRESSEETMLRCVLEGYTYLQIVSKDNLFKSFDIPIDYKLKASPLVFKDGFQYKEYMDNDRKFLHDLMKELDCTPFFVETKLAFNISTM